MNPEELIQRLEDMIEIQQYSSGERALGFIDGLRYVIRILEED